MSDRYVEKSFLYLLAFSVLLHLAAFQLIGLIPAKKVREQEKATMVDLADLPDLPVPKTKPVPRVRETWGAPRTATAPRVSERVTTRRSASVPVPAQARPPQSQAAASPPKGVAALPRESTPLRPTREKGEPASRGDGILRPGSAEGIDRSKLFPSAGRMARLEDEYRAKYRREVKDGETRFLNTEDVQFGSFMRRLEVAVYGTWRYPEAALAAGIEGTTPVLITFNRDGEIVQVELLESSGSRILDDEVFRTLKELGPIGSLPRGFSGDRFKLIAFFHYGNGSGRLR